MPQCIAVADVLRNRRLLVSAAAHDYHIVPFEMRISLSSCPGLCLDANVSDNLREGAVEEG